MQRLLNISVCTWMRNVCVVQNPHDRGTGHARVPGVEDKLVVRSEVVSARECQCDAVCTLLQRKSPNSLDGFAYSGVLLRLLHNASHATMSN
jgi:hypothetical protein